jgi:hypothetical protein
MTHIARDEDGKFASYAWPGGYPIVHITDDGGCLCPKCANAEGHTNDFSDGFRVVGSDINWEDTALFCDHCNERIESAYGEE